MTFGRAERGRAWAGAGTAARTIPPARSPACMRRCWTGLVVILALAWCNDALAAENRVILLRGYLGLFSNGLDELADELKAQGFSVEVRKHLYWTDVVNDLLRRPCRGQDRHAHLRRPLAGRQRRDRDRDGAAGEPRRRRPHRGAGAGLSEAGPGKRGAGDRLLPGRRLGLAAHPRAGLSRLRSRTTTSRAIRASRTSTSPSNPRIRAEVIREIEVVPQAASARAQKPLPPARKPPAAR